MARGSLISRITAVGLAAAILALVLWPLAARYDAAVWPFLALLGLAALAGAGVLLLTGADLLLRPRRGERVAPIRVFDVVSGAALLALAFVLVHWLGGWLPQ